MSASRVDRGSEEEPIAKVECCDRFCIRMSGWQLQIMNFVDFILGVLMLYFAFSMYDKIGNEAFVNPDLGWLCWLTLGIGLLLVLSVLMASCGLTGGDNMRWWLTPSAYLGMLVGLVATVIAVVVFEEKTDVYDHLDQHGTDYGLTTDEIADIKSRYTFIGPTLLAIFIIQVFRYRASGHYRRNIGRLDGEFEALLEEDDRAYADKLQNNKNQREAKYDNLRTHYKNKYNPPAGTSALVTGTASSAGGGDVALGGNVV